MKAFLPGILLLCSLVFTSVAAEPKKVLVVTTTAGFRHSSIPQLEEMLRDLSARSGGAFTVDFVSQPAGEPASPGGNASEAERAEYEKALAAWRAEKLASALEALAPERLADYDAVVFASTTGDLPIPDREGLLQWVRDGHGLVGIHAASDTFPSWPEFREMLGGSFDYHRDQTGVDCLIEDPGHPATAALPRPWPIAQEEIYLIKDYEPSKVRELLILDRHPNEGTPGHFPLAWCRDYGKGRVFYTALGHREDLIDPTFGDRKNPPETAGQFRAHVLGGLEWALGLEPGSAGGGRGR